MKGPREQIMELHLADRSLSDREIASKVKCPITLVSRTLGYERRSKSFDYIRSARPASSTPKPKLIRQRDFDPPEVIETPKPKPAPKINIECQRKWLDKGELVQCLDKTENGATYCRACSDHLRTFLDRSVPPAVHGAAA